MIGSLRGVLLARLGDDEVLVEVQGVGYRVTVTPATVVQLGEAGDDAFLFVHHHIREGAQTLYGFQTDDERVCFEVLLSAHGVGPSLALAILSVHDPNALATLLATDDIGALCLVPGVGKKTAARLLVELKERLDIDSFAPPASAAGGGPGSGTPDPNVFPSSSGARSPIGDVRDALAELGYGADEVAGALRNLRSDDDPAALLRQALQRLAVS